MGRFFLVFESLHKLSQHWVAAGTFQSSVGGATHICGTKGPVVFATQVNVIASHVDKE